MRAPAMAASLAWVLGCATSAHPPTRTPAPDPAPASGLVWLVDASGRHRTLWVSTRDGRPLSSLPIEGPLWAEGSMLWQWTEEPVEVPLVDCDADPALRSARAAQHGAPSEDRVVGTAVGVRVVLRELTQPLSLEVRAAPSLSPVRALSHGVEPVASVGTYLFAREELRYDPCGAGASAEARTLVWDLATVLPTEILSDAERAAATARAHARLRRRGLEDVAPLELAALAPRWDLRRGLSLEYVFVAGGCLVCPASETSARVRTALLPDALAPSARVPRWVAAALARVDGATLLGFSRVDHPAPLRVLETLRR